MTNKTFKKIIALAMAIALVVCFAVSASATMDVVTTTTYVDGGDNIQVTVNVTGANQGSVTYYAKNGNDIVYVDQAAVGAEGTASFNFKTEEANKYSAVLMGNSNDTVREDVIPEPAPVGEGFSATCFGYGATDDTLTVLGKVTGASEYGIILLNSASVSTTTGLTYVQLTELGDVYQAVACNSVGGFAVQLVEAEGGENFVVKDGSYNVAVYAKSGSTYSVALVD